MAKKQSILKKTASVINGKKSYFIAVLLVVLSGLKGEGYITIEQYELALGLLSAAGLAALRHSIK